jgi:AraC-like DNA-binding protein
VRNGHLAGGNLFLRSTDETELAASQGIAVGHTDRRPEDTANHRTPFVYVAKAGLRVERRAGSVVGKVFEARLIGFGGAKQARAAIAREFRAMLADPLTRAPLEVAGQLRIGRTQHLHSSLEAHGIERVDCKGAVATLGAAGAAGEPRAGATGGVSKGGVHDLNELVVAVRKRHLFRVSVPGSWLRLGEWLILVLAETWYNRIEVALLYLERIPAAPLDPYIRVLWYARAADVPHHRERVLPSGCVQIILNLARDYLLDCPEGRADCRMSPGLVVGARSVYEIVDTSDMADLIGIVFTPGGFPVFASDAAHLFSNRSIALEGVWGDDAEGLRARLWEIGQPQARLACLEQFLLAKFGNRIGDHVRSPQVNFALRYFAHNPMIASVRETARQIGWSERRFSQVFREEVGLTPKVWCRVQRFQRAVKQLHAGIEVRWAELALDSGYYDQSHFANEFRAFSGVDARTYTMRRTQWANHIPVD